MAHMNSNQWPGGPHDDAMYMRYVLFAMLGLWVLWLTAWLT